MSTKKIIKLVACICAQDGIVSEIELETTLKLVNKKIEKIDKKTFYSYIEKFFEEDLSLEEYLLAIPKKHNPDIILEICAKAATSDGLEIRENFAFDKACKFWQRNIKDFTK
jgi:hypothetical protein|tara:strand:- start:5219 stop:5554 length:336 start_codon:yes stop_codon:yes gene_type:complete